MKTPVFRIAACLLTIVFLLPFCACARTGGYYKEKDHTTVQMDVFGQTPEMPRESERSETQISTTGAISEKVVSSAAPSEFASETVGQTTGETIKTTPGQPRSFKLLLIGNSFSQDAVCWNFEGADNMLLSIFRALIGEDADILVGVCQSGCKTMAWHASAAKNDGKVYSFHVISSCDPTWTQPEKGEVSSMYALSYADWDAVSIQPFRDECETGVAHADYPDEEEEEFYPFDASVPYMLDFVSTHAPRAKTYIFLPWAESVESCLDAGLERYERMRRIFENCSSYRGVKTGKTADGIIPIGLAVQNARTTYLSTINYRTDDYAHSQDRAYDVQFGLLRDGLHLSFNVGRYIAALCLARTVLSCASIAEEAPLPGIRRSEALGELPNEYTVIAQAAVGYALRSLENGSFEITRIEGYERIPDEYATVYDGQGRFCNREDA